MQTELTSLSASIVAAYVSNNPVVARELPDLIKSVHSTVIGLANGTATSPADRPKPAVSIAKSIAPDYIVCLEDGKRLKMLKRYIRSRFDLTPDQYRERWGLRRDYPMVAPNYAASRSDFAKKIGLGTKAAGSKIKKKH